MNPRTVLIALFLTAAPWLAPAAAANLEAAGTPAGAEANDGPARPWRARPTTRVQMLLEVSAEGRQQVHALQLAISSARDRAQVLVLERQIEAVKRDIDIRILRLQAGFARQDGATQVAEYLEAAVARLIAPPAIDVPSVNPASAVTP